MDFIGLGVTQPMTTSITMITSNIRPFHSSLAISSSSAVAFPTRKEHRNEIEQKPCSEQFYSTFSRPTCSESIVTGRHHRLSKRAMHFTNDKLVTRLLHFSQASATRLEIYVKTGRLLTIRMPIEQSAIM